MYTDLKMYYPVLLQKTIEKCRLCWVNFKGEQ